ncbi:MAG: hypothetical protein WCB04_03105 [Mycobacteriales bacterium]
MVQGRPAVVLDEHEVPLACHIGDFPLEIDKLTAGRWDEAAGVLRGVTGRAWLHLPCARPPIRTGGLLDHPDISLLTHAVEVVTDVLHPQTQISIAEAQQVRPDVRLGDTISLDLAVEHADLQEIVGLRRGVLDWLDSDPRTARFPVDLNDVTISVAEAKRGLARVVDGSVTYPVAGPLRGPIEIVIDGFTVVISSLELTPRRSTGVAEVRLPGGLTDVDSCQPATIDLGLITMSPQCEFYIDAPDQAYGPWLLSDTGLVIEGTGYVLDLSTTMSPPPRPPAWRGLTLGSGTATGEQVVPDPCNTGYLRGHYTFSDAIVIGSGFFGSIYLADPVSFTAINPLGQTFSFDNGAMDVWYSQIARGELRDGWTELLVDAVCEGAPGRVVRTPIAVVSIQPDLDLAGALDHGKREISWGELTHHGDEVIAWTGIFGLGYLYLPAGAYESYSPVATGVFSGPTIDSVPDASLAELEAGHVAGVSFPSLSGALVFSPDRPGGRSNPIKLDRLYGWIHVGITGVDGALSTYLQTRPEKLGDPRSTGYAGNIAFESTLFANDKQNLLAEFVTSASFDSNFAGRFEIPTPCHIPQLNFTQMKLTSTACLVGGEVVLPSAGVPLWYWDLQLVPTGPPDHSGVVSVRTGRVLLTAAGLAEPLHFTKPFGLTWGEMLADGNLGQLYLDFNNWGQRFDGLVFNPHELTLSAYDPAVTDPYLGVFGPIFFPFFGLHDVNIRDATDLLANSPRPRMVTVPKASITPHARPTELALSGTWHDVNSDDLAVFECLEVDVDYNVAGQNGFLGTGSTELGFLHSAPLDIEVEIHSDATDIHISSVDTHDIDLGLFARLGGIGEIAGCARIEGTTLARLTLYGTLEQSAAAGSIFGPKVGYETEIDISVTPTTFDFYASGDMLLSAVVDLEVSATAHLLFDYAMGSAEGELYGRIDCDAVVAGLSGEGQLTWHVSSAMQYLQGRLKVGVISLIVSGGLEGGFFIGNNVPKALAWVLDPTNTHFGMSRNILPATLTGVFGYGQASIGVNYYVVGGGVDIYAGAGAFSAPVTAGGPLAPFAGNPLLPYVVGACGIYVHGEILGGLVSASAWANLSLRGPIPTYFEGTFGLRGCVAWVLCASVNVTAGINSSGFYLA